MEGRNVDGPIAATRYQDATDVDFGALTKGLAQKLTDFRTGHEVTRLRRQAGRPRCESPPNLHLFSKQRPLLEAQSQCMKIKGPIATLGAVAALGIGIWLVNVNSQPEPRPVTATATSAPAAAAPVAPPAPPTPTATPFAAHEDFVATIATKNGDLPLEIRVTGTTARAYACDNKTIETWLSGTAINGELKLDSKDKTSHLEGRHQGNTVVGNLRIGEKNWDFTATPGETSAF